MSTNHLLIIDAQNDFCDLPAAWLPTDPVSTPGSDSARVAPALPVPGSHADMQRLAGLLRDAGGAIDAVTLTLDSHPRIGIERPGFWRTRDGRAVSPFTQITRAAFEAGDYLPWQAADRTIARDYLAELERRARYTLMVWPEHCVVGTWGHAIHAEVDAALGQWERVRHANAARVLKGRNPYTEHYSAIAAEVPRAGEPDTLPNADLLARLARAHRILVAGEAGSHCVKATVEDVADYLGPTDVRKLVLIADCMSPVSGFEAHQRIFLADMQARGARLCTTAEALALVRDGETAKTG